MKMRRSLVLVSACLLLLLPQIARGDEDVQLVPLSRVVDAIAHAHVVTISAYTLSPRSRVGRVLLSAARGGAQVSLVLDGAGMASANRANASSATAYAAGG